MDKSNTKKTICITGGHLTPALAVIEEIQEKKKSWDIVFVGRQHTSLDSKGFADEKRIIEELHIPFVSLKAGRLKRYLSFSALIECLMIPVGFVHACSICLRYRPDTILSFGGYVGLPMVVAGWLFGIPTIIHEQTHALGLANRIASQLATSVLLTFPDTKHVPSECHREVVGLPIRKAFFHPKKTASFAVRADAAIIYITGGTTGAVTLNELLFPSIQSLTSSHVVIHQTGQPSYEKAMMIKQQLPKEHQVRYKPFAYIETDDVAWIMHHMDLLIGRSGANTTMEVAAVHKPAVFIPLPWGGNKEQLQNALWYQKIGTVRIIDQKTTTPNKVFESIQTMLQQQQGELIAKQAISASKAATSIVDVMASVLS